MPKNGLEALLAPEDCCVVLIDHQPSQLANVHSHEPTLIVNTVLGLAKAAKAHDVPCILTTLVAARGGNLIPALQAVYPDQVPIDRTYITTWQDERVGDAVKAQGSQAPRARGDVDRGVRRDVDHAALDRVGARLPAARRRCAT